MPKHVDNPYARAAAREFIGTISDRPMGTDPSDAVVALFPAIEFESADTRVSGETVNLRRVILVGPWEATSGEDRT